MMTKNSAIVWLVVAFVFCAPAFSEAQSPSDIRPWLLAASGHYGEWGTDDLENSGDQAFSYLQVAYDTKKWGITVTSKGSDTHYETEATEGAFDITTLTDTTIASYYALNFKSLSIRPGIDFTLPMGKAGYTNGELVQIITDPISGDLMIANVYGEGVNIVPHVTAVYQATDKLTLGIGARYELTGEYDMTEEVDDEKLDPGDRLLFVANTAYQLSERRFLTLLLTYQNYGNDSQGGEDIYKTGDTYSAEIRYLHGWFEAFNSVFSIAYYTQGKNESLDESSVLNSEQNNSNNNMVELYMNNVYRHSKMFSLLGMVGYKSVDANDYSDGDTYYDAGRTKIFIEPGVILYLSQYMYVTLKGRYSVIEDKADTFSSTDASYDIYNLDAGVVFSF